MVLFRREKSKGWLFLLQIPLPGQCLIMGLLDFLLLPLENYGE